MTERTEQALIATAIGSLAVAAFVLKAIEAANAYVSWRVKGKTLPTTHTASAPLVRRR